MRYIICSLFFLFTFSTIAQSEKKVRKGLTKVTNYDEAIEFKKANPEWTTSVRKLTQQDSTLYSDILKTKVGSVVKYHEDYRNIDLLVKVIDTTSKSTYTCQYIYLDGSKLSMESIDSLRTIILDKYENGTQFIDLVKNYTMDGNPDGMLRYIPDGMMQSDFETAVKNHDTNDVFTIDVPDNKWYYVTLKIASDEKVKFTTILKVKYNS